MCCQKVSRVPFLYSVSLDFSSFASALNVICSSKNVQVMSHEAWSCPWTGEVIEQSLFGEEVGCAACSLPWDGRDCENLTPRTASPGATRTEHDRTRCPKLRTRAGMQRLKSTDDRTPETRARLWKCAKFALVSASSASVSSGCPQATDPPNTEAILQSGWTPDSFLDALLAFFHLLVEKTKLFEDHEIIVRSFFLCTLN